MEKLIYQDTRTLATKLLIQKQTKPFIWHEVKGEQKVFVGETLADCYKQYIAFVKQSGEIIKEGLTDKI